MPGSDINIRVEPARLPIPLRTNPMESRVGSGACFRQQRPIRLVAIGVDHLGILIDRSRHRAQSIREVVYPRTARGLLPNDLPIQAIVVGDWHTPIILAIKAVEGGKAKRNRWFCSPNLLATDASGLVTDLQRQSSEAVQQGAAFGRKGAASRPQLKAVASHRTPKSLPAKPSVFLCDLPR